MLKGLGRAMRRLAPDPVDDETIAKLLDAEDALLRQREAIARRKITPAAVETKV